MTEEALHQPTEPRFQIGDVVAIIDDAKGRRGPIYHRVWHFKEGVWFYFISNAGRKEYKRFAEPELRAAD
jgi:hypothetical protein